MTEKVGRNQACHCGSGQKYKRCCLPTDREASHLVPVLGFLVERPRVRQRDFTAWVHEQALAKAAEGLYARLEEVREELREARGFPDADVLEKRWRSLLTSQASPAMVAACRKWIKRRIYDIDPGLDQIQRNGRRGMAEVPAAGPMDWAAAAVETESDWGLEVLRAFPPSPQWAEAWLALAVIDPPMLDFWYHIYAVLEQEQDAEELLAAAAKRLFVETPPVGPDWRLLFREDGRVYVDILRHLWRKDQRWTVLYALAADSADEETAYHAFFIAEPALVDFVREIVGLDFEILDRQAREQLLPDGPGFAEIDLEAVVQEAEPVEDGDFVLRTRMLDEPDERAIRCRAGTSFLDFARLLMQLWEDHTFDCPDTWEFRDALWRKWRSATIMSTRHIMEPDPHNWSAEADEIRLDQWLLHHGNPEGIQRFWFDWDGLERQVIQVELESIRWPSTAPTAVEILYPGEEE